MIEGHIIRSARCYLDWTRHDLARHSNVSPETIKNLESGKYKGHGTTQAQVMKALEAQGLVVTEDGVSPRKPCPNCGFNIATQEGKLAQTQKT